MDCRTFELLLDRTEEEWTQDELREAREHAAICAHCRMLWNVRREMADMDRDEPLPPAFSESWKEKIRTEAEHKMNIRLASLKRPLAAVAAVAVLVLGTTVSYNNRWGDSRRSSAAYQAGSDYDAGYGYSASAKRTANTLQSLAAAPEGALMEDSVVFEAEETAYGAADDPSVSPAKIIRTVSFTLKTRQYERDYQQIRDLTEACGGRIESLSISGDGSASSLRRAEFTLRIPSARLDDFISDARSAGNVSAYSESSDDVSDSYYDIQSRLHTQQAKLARLTEMMEKADSIEDLIRLESAISETQYLIDRYSGQIGSYDSRVNDSTVYITLRELSSADAAEVKELGLGERILNAVRGSLETAGEVAQAFIIFLLSALPWIAAGAVLILAVRALLRRRKARREKREQE